MIELPLCCLNCHNQVLELTRPRADKWTFTLSGVSLPVYIWLTFRFFHTYIYIYIFSRKESLSFATQIVLLGGQFLLFQWVTSAACLQPAPAPGVMDTGLKVDSVVNMNWNIFISYSTCGFLHILHNSTLRESEYIAYVHENLIILIPVLSRGLN